MTILILILYILMMIGIGVSTHSKSSSIDGFVLGGRNVGRQARIYADEKIRYVGAGIAVDKIGKVLFGKRGYTRLRSRIYKMIRVFIENQAHNFFPFVL